MRAALRRRSAAPLATALYLVDPRVAYAIGCHSAAPLDGEPGLLLALNHEVASFHNRSYEGHYQGLSLRGGWQDTWAAAELALPAHRVVRNGRVDRGLGDLAFDARARFLGDSQSTPSAGATFGATLPTGDADAHLSMDHPMLSAGVWGATQFGDLTLELDLGYGRVLRFDNEAAGHVHGQSPIVNPMNPSELTTSLSALVNIRSPFELRGGLEGAAPLGEGSARGAAFIGGGFGQGTYRTSIDGYVGILGDPFDLKLVLELGVRL